MKNKFHGQQIEGEVIAYPTESFWALGASPFDFKAVGKILDMKGRDNAKGVSCICSSIDTIERLIASETREVKQKRELLIYRHWPGPLTLIFTVREDLHDIFSPGIFGPGGSLALRVSPLATAQQMADFFGGIVTSTSANPHKAHPPLIAKDVVSYFPKIKVSHPSHVCNGGLPSTFVDVRTFPFKIVREGSKVIDSEELK